VLALVLLDLLPLGSLCQIGNLPVVSLYPFYSVPGLPGLLFPVPIIRCNKMLLLPEGSQVLG